MAARRRSESVLPHAPLELLHPMMVPTGAVPGSEILSEIHSPEGVPLLVLFRAALQWSHPHATAPSFDAREIARIETQALSRLSEGGCWPAIAVIANGLAEPDADRSGLAQACFCVAEWALGHEAHQTGVAFAMLGSLVWPWHPRYAWAAARLLRSYGRMREAESWFARAYRVAVWMEDRVAQAKSLASLGVIAYIGGNHARAERRLQRARKVAARFGLELVEGEALHDLFVLEMERQRLALAEEYAALALERYLPRHDRIPALAHDTACLWMNQGQFSRALPLLQRIAEYMRDPAERFQTHAATARAAGGVGELEAFRCACNRAFAIAGSIPANRLRAAALVDLARGASSLALWDEARAAFSEALAIAVERGENDVRFKAEAGLDAVERHAAADAAARSGRCEKSGRDEVAELLIHGVRLVRTKERPRGDAPPAPLVAA